MDGPSMRWMDGGRQTCTEDEGEKGNIGLQGPRTGVLATIPRPGHSHVLRHQLLVITLPQENQPLE